MSNKLSIKGVRTSIRTSYISWGLSLVVTITMQADLTAQMIDSSQFNKIAIKWNPTRLIPDVLGLNYSNIAVSGEYAISSISSMSAEFGYIISGSSSNGNLAIQASQVTGFSTSLEWRYYMKKYKILKPTMLLFWPTLFQLKSTKSIISGYYYSTSVFYQNTRTSRDETLSNGEFPDILYYQNTYEVVRNVVAIHGNIGYQAIKKKGFVFDQAIGIGIRYIESQSVDKQGQGNNDIELLTRKPYDTGSKLFPSLLYQIRIGWAIK